MGLFYCRADEKVSLGIQFFDHMARRFHADGDFARAYVMAHEIGHHAQHPMGITEQLRAWMRETQFDKASVRMKLQADCFAGMWAHHGNRATVHRTGGH
jgi:predicted metalloprotease